jgi:hypothetical protein
MWRKLLFCIVLAVTAVLFLALTAGSSDGLDATRDVIGYNVLAERLFEGSVEAKPYIVRTMVYFALRTADSLVQVQVAPKDFFKRSNFKIDVGDSLTVTGMPIVMNGRDVVLAREIKGPKGVLVVRNPMGVPVWEGEGPMKMDPERRMQSWEICDVIQ